MGSAKYWFVAALLAFGLWHLAAASYIYLKAQLAQRLLSHAWHETRITGKPSRPWPWADTWPVARLIAPDHAADIIVLEGSSGRSLAFAPGHLAGTPLPGDAGNSIISAHRDTHFRFLKDVRIGDRLLVELPSGDRRAFRVQSTAIIDTHRAHVLERSEKQLTLVTCYPFDALRANTPLRFVVIAEPADVRSTEL